MSNYQRGTSVEVLVGERKGQVGTFLNLDRGENGANAANLVAFEDTSLLYYLETELTHFNDSLETHSRTPYGGRERSGFGESKEYRGEPFLNDRR